MYVIFPPFPFGRFFVLQVLGEEQSVIDTARDENSVRLAILSCLVNAQQLQPYVFRK